MTQLLHPQSPPCDGDWKAQLKDVITDGETLLATLGLEPAALGLSAAACAEFSLRGARGLCPADAPGGPP